MLISRQREAIESLTRRTFWPRGESRQKWKFFLKDKEEKKEIALLGISWKNHGPCQDSVAVFGLERPAEPFAPSDKDLAECRFAVLLRSLEADDFFAFAAPRFIFPREAQKRSAAREEVTMLIAKEIGFDCTVFELNGPSEFYSQSTIT